MKITIPFTRSQLRINNVRHMRWVEDKRRVPLVVLGRIYIAYWNRATIEWDKRVS